MTLALAADMLVSAGLAADHRSATARALDALETGRATETFGRMVRALGGPGDFVEQARRHLPTAPVTAEVASPASGYVASIATRDIGVAVVALGGGRTRPQDPVDPAVGLAGLLPVGAEIRAGEPLAVVHARNEASARTAAKSVAAAYAIAPARPRPGKTILRRVAADA